MAASTAPSNKCTHRGRSTSRKCRARTPEAVILVFEMRPYRVLLRGQGVFFPAQSSADCITDMSGFDLRQPQVAYPPRIFLVISATYSNFVADRVE